MASPKNTTLGKHQFKINKQKKGNKLSLTSHPLLQKEKGKQFIGKKQKFRRSILDYQQPIAVSFNMQYKTNIVTKTQDVPTMMCAPFFQPAQPPISPLAPLLHNNCSLQQNLSFNNWHRHHINMQMPI
jgi:hypothetical protein